MLHLVDRGLGRQHHTVGGEHGQHRGVLAGVVGEVGIALEQGLGILGVVAGLRIVGIDAVVFDDVGVDDGEVLEDGSEVGGVGTREGELLGAGLGGGDRDRPGEQDRAPINQRFDVRRDVVDGHRPGGADADGGVAGHADSAGAGNGQRLRLRAGAGVHGEAGGIGDGGVDDASGDGLDDLVDGHRGADTDRDAGALRDADRNAHTSGVGGDDRLVAGLDPYGTAGVERRVDDFGDGLRRIAVDIADLVPGARTGGGKGERAARRAGADRTGDAEGEGVDGRRRGRLD